MVMEHGWNLALVLLLAVSACDNRSVSAADASADGPAALDGTIDSGPPSDLGSHDLATLDLTANDLPANDLPALDLPALDALSDATINPDQDACYCASGEVWLRGSCVPTEELGCGPTCDPASPTSCPAGWTCDQWAAAPCCMCSAAVPACVQAPTSGPGSISGPLRLTPTSGTAGQSVTLTIEGAPFYIGALFYLIRMGNEQQMDQPTGQDCATSASFTPPTPGIYPVEVSQYGGGPPWALAGFYTASAGAPLLPTVQPGYPCATNPAPGDPACVSAAPYTCTCVSGRCTCQ